MPSFRQQSRGFWLAEGINRPMSPIMGMAQAPDETIWNFALGISAVIVTKDEDFVTRRLRSRTGPAGVWLRFPNLRKKELLTRVEMLLPTILLALESGETLIEIV